MNSTDSTQSKPSPQGQGYREQFKAQLGEYLDKQPAFVRGLHQALKVLALICLALAIIFGIVAVYYTILWAATGSFTSLGEATYLPEAWVNFGLSMSFLVFPWGLDAMLLRAFPTDAFFPIAYGKTSKPINFFTGIGAFFAGFGVMCAGAPGAARMIELASQAIQNLF